MSDALVPNLNFGANPSRAVPLPRRGQLLLITDHLAASAEFVLHRTLHLGLKTLAALPDVENVQLQLRLQPRVLLVYLSRDLAHWRAIASKSGVNLTPHLRAGSLAFVDCLAISAYGNAANAKQDDEAGCTRCPPLFLVGGAGVESGPSLKGLYDVIQKALLAGPVNNENENENGDEDEAEPSASAPVVIFDDITVLSFIGISDTAITRFIRALRALCRRRSAGLIVRAHAAAAQRNAESMPFASDTLRALINSSHRHVEVRPLASGRSGAISGEVAVHFGGLGVDNGDDIDAGGKMGRATAVHYRLSDSGATFFQKGTSVGIL